MPAARDAGGTCHRAAGVDAAGAQPDLGHLASADRSAILDTLFRWPAGAAVADGSRHASPGHPGQGTAGQPPWRITPIGLAIVSAGARALSGAAGAGHNCKSVPDRA